MSTTLISDSLAPWPETIMSEKKRNLLLQLIYTTAGNNTELEKWLSYLESASDCDADELIENLSNVHA